jgi:uncharacterized membrane protein
MPRWLTTIGRIFYGVGLVGIGIQHFIFRNFIPVILPIWPSSIPGRTFCAYVAGAALVAAGVAITCGAYARVVGTWTGAVLLVLVVIGQIPAQLMAYPAHLGVWTNAFKELSLCGGAWVAAGSVENGRSRFSVRPGILALLMPWGKYFLPITVAVFGVDHFLYPEFVATLVPAWIPGHVFWTYFAGVALIASGVAIIVGVKARLAALLLGIMIFSWFIVLHIPRAMADPHSGMGNEWTSVFEALAFSGIAFMLASLPVGNRFAVRSSH